MRLLRKRFRAYRNWTSQKQASAQAHSLGGQATLSQSAKPLRELFYERAGAAVAR